MALTMKFLETFCMRWCV